MTKLNDLQLILLSAAGQRKDGHFLPLPEAAAEKAGPANKALAALLKKDLASEARTKKANQTWREEGEVRVGLVITKAGLKAVGITPPEDPSNPGTQGAAEPVPSAASGRKLREGSKQQLVVDLLRRPSGATIQEMVEATGWLPHTTRAALTGLKKRGFVTTSQKTDGVSRYKIEDGKAPDPEGQGAAADPARDQQ